MIIRDSVTPKGRRVDLPNGPDHLAPIRRHLHARASSVSWREMSDRSWANRERLMQENQ